MADRALLDHISRLPHARANFKQLVRELGVKGTTRTELEAALVRLTARGDLIELRGGQHIVTERSREFAVGRLSLHRDGYGFLISERQSNTKIYYTNKHFPIFKELQSIVLKSQRTTQKKNQL